MPLIRTTDQPLFGQPAGTLANLVNMELRPGGFAQMRGGLDKMKPSGGTSADPISAGAYSSVIQTATSYGWVRTFNSAAGAGSQYSGSRILHEGGWLPFATGVVNDAIYFGADFPFSKIGIGGVTVAGAWVSVTFTYEYWNGASWSALTLGASPLDGLNFGSSSPSYAGWTLPTDWAATSVGDSGTGNVYKYWMRVRISAVNTWTTSPRVQYAYVYGSGLREVYAATASPQGGVLTGALKRYGQSGTTAEWFSVNSSLFAGNASPARMVEYRGRVILVNGHDTKRWDGANFVDLGIPKFTGSITVAAAALASGMGAGIWRYYAAWGCGPCQLTGTSTDRQDAQALYGQGQATYLSEVTTTAGANEKVNLTLTTAPPAGVSAIYIYRTDDLTNVPPSQRSYAPAFLINSKRIAVSGSYFEDGFGNGTAYGDTLPSKVFPQQEAYTYDISPPTNCKYAVIHLNRLMLGDDETWWISDPFMPDRFTQKATNYIRLAKATGGRHMGGISFGYQAVLWTEDQTWGVLSLDLDVPQLIPVALGIGCIAPDAARIVDGELIWPARDGFYGWFGGLYRHHGAQAGGPQRISDDWRGTFGTMSYESQGGSRAASSLHRYDIRLHAPGGAGGAAYRFNALSRTWSRLSFSGFSSTLSPIGSIHAPLGNSDAGQIHPVWGKVDYGTGAGDYSAYLGELTTQDNGNAITASATMYFPLAPNQLFSLNNVLAYYLAPDGWASPTFSLPSTAWGSDPGSLIANTPNIGTDYSMVVGNYTGASAGTSDIVVKFQATSIASGTVNGQRLFGAVVQGSPKGIRRIQ